MEKSTYVKEQEKTALKALKELFKKQASLSLPKNSLLKPA